MIPRHITWFNRLSRLPPRLSVLQVARRLRANYNITRYWMLKLGYRRADGRRTHWSKARLKVVRRMNPARADWSLSNQELAARFGAAGISIAQAL